MSAEAYPLQWPVGWERTEQREPARFGRTSVREQSIQVLDELERLGGLWPVISTNVQLRLDGLPRSGQPAPRDPGVAVYFELEDPFEGYAPRVLACDRWERVEHNLRAIAKHVEALRGIERWGVGSVERAFTGYAALPATGESRSVSWWITLGLPGPGVSLAELKAAYRSNAKETAPRLADDDDSAFRLVRQAYEQGQAAIEAAI